MNPITAAQHHVDMLLARHIDLFLGLGHHVFVGAATILIAWFGIQTMLRPTRALNTSSMSRRGSTSCASTRESWHP
jgi:hypothetical protein